MDVRLPNGQIIANVPEGTTQEDLLARLTEAGHDTGDLYAQLPRPKMHMVGREGFRQAARDVAQETGKAGRFLQGIGETFDRYAYGAKGLFTDLTPEDRARLQQNKVMSEESGVPALAGQVGGDLLITAPVMMAGGAAAPVAGRMLPQALARHASSLPARAVGAVAPGAALGSLSDPEDRVEGAAWGAAGSMVGGLPRAMRVIRGRAGRAGAAGGAAREIGETPEALAAKIEQGLEQAKRLDVPVTAAQAAGSPALAARELGVRGTMPEEFAHFARQQNEAIYNAMRRATQSAEKLDDLARARDSVTRPLREAALEAAEKQGGYVEPLLAHVQALKGGATGGNPNVARIADMVERELTREGGTSAARLYELQKYLVGKLTGPHQIGDEVSAAVRGAEREVVGLRNAINEALNKSSGGHWDAYRSAYQQASRYVDDAAASAALRESAQVPGRALVGQAPHVTARTLERDIAKAAESRFGERFLPQTRQELDELTAFAKRIEEPMRTLKLAGTGGGGSQTTMQAAQVVANALDLIPGGSVVRAPLMSAVKAMRSADQQRLAYLLLNPEEAVKALRTAAIEGKPLTKAEQVFVHIARTAGRTEASTGAASDALRSAIIKASGE